MPKVRATGKETRRHNVSLRVTPTIMERIDAALAESGLSLSQELEARIVRSFELDDALDPANLRFFHALRTRLDLVQAVTGAEHWTESFSAWHAVSELLPQVLKEFRPVPPNATAIVAAMEAEQQAKEQARAEMERLRSMRPDELAPAPNALIGQQGAMLLQAAMGSKSGSAETHPDGSPRTEDEIAAIRAQEERAEAAYEAWKSCRVAVEAAWAEATRQQEEGSKLAKRIIELGERFDAPPFPE